jgi:hypothetical protein
MLLMHYENGPMAGHVKKIMQYFCKYFCVQRLLSDVI